MNIELGDPIPGSKAKRRPKLKVVHGGLKRKPRGKKNGHDETVVDLKEAEFEEDPPRGEKNSMGIEGVENPTRAFIAKMTGLQKAKQKIASEIGVASAAAKAEGVPVKVVLRVMAELKRDVDEFIDDQNVMNQVRRLVSLPHSPFIELQSSHADDAVRDEHAYQAGRRHCWRGGREADNPYADDQARGQSWAKGYREAYVEGEAASNSSTMHKATQKT